ncbi:MAG: TlyA family RNA methyltransferase [Candidatus Saccharimonadales bacterium]|nr:TlyA family RNA methyltransferase [Candidatus Saccharimonadales bacterium]
MKRLDEMMAKKGLVQSRSQAANLIKLGKVLVDGRTAKKPGQAIKDSAVIEIVGAEKYVSRAGFKLASANEIFEVDFRGKTVLDVGSSTGGFTDYALQNGAKKVIAVDVGTDQLHPSLAGDKRIELHEKTDIRDYITNNIINNIVIDVSFISMQEILPAVYKLANGDTLVIAMLKPQFEAGPGLKHKGVIKNSKMRRKILQEFEVWVKQKWVILKSTDSQVSGAKGNTERFYLLKKQVR